MIKLVKKSFVCRACTMLSLLGICVAVQITFPSIILLLTQNNDIYSIDVLIIVRKTIV